MKTAPTGTKPDWSSSHIDVGLLSIQFDSDSDVDLRTLADPLGAVQSSFAELFGPLRYRVPHAVVKRARQLARFVDLEMLLCVTPDGQLPAIEDFLCPGSTEAGAFSLRDQLEMIAATPVETIYRDVQRVAELDSGSGSIDEIWHTRWLDNPEKTLTRYVDAMASYIREVIENLYPDFERRIHREANWFDHVISRGTVESSLLDPHPRIQLSAQRLDVEFLDSGKQQVDNPVLVLAPMICSATTIGANGDEDDSGRWQMISFASTNLAVTGLGTPVDDRRDPLGALIGGSRAAIFRRLRCPSTTTELANTLGYTPSTISHHLKALLDATAIEKHRIGAKVYYRLSDTGHQLLRTYRG